MNINWDNQNMVLIGAVIVAIVLYYLYCSNQKKKKERFVFDAIKKADEVIEKTGRNFMSSIPGF
jgi:preprotein translocase subunit YajC